jgi:hypothetical protein
MLACRGLVLSPRPSHHLLNRPMRGSRPGQSRVLPQRAVRNWWQQERLRPLIRAPRKLSRLLAFGLRFRRAFVSCVVARRTQTRFRESGVSDCSFPAHRNDFVSDQIGPENTVPRKSLNDLACDPLRRRVGRDVDPNDISAINSHNH